MKRPRRLSKGGKKASDIDKELPSAVTLITLMAIGGITPYESFRRLRNFGLLPNIKKVAEEIVRHVEVLSEDPLSVMENQAEKTGSRGLQDLLSGYVATVRTGGSVTHFLKSIMRSMYELNNIIVKQTVEKVKGLVEAYMITQVIIMSVYIIIVAISTTPSSFLAAPPLEFIYGLIYGAMPAACLIFFMLAHQIWRGTLISTNDACKRGLIISAVAPIIVSIIVLTPAFSILKESIRLPYLAGAFFAAISVKPYFDYRRFAQMNLSAEMAMPKFVRDVAEARKTGLSPEKCIVHAARRRDYGVFTRITRSLADQLEWGVSLKKVYTNVAKRLQSWPVLVNFLILVEVIEMGGGHPDMLDILAESNEKYENVEKERRSMLKLYALIPFMVMGLLGFTTIITAQALASIQLSMAERPVTSFGTISQLIDVFSLGIVAHSWLTGFFVGKVTTGTFSGGHKYTVALVAMTCCSIFFSTGLPVDFSRAIGLTV